MFQGVGMQQECKGGAGAAVHAGGQGVGEMGVVGVPRRQTTCMHRCYNLCVCGVVGDSNGRVPMQWLGGGRCMM